MFAVGSEPVLPSSRTGIWFHLGFNQLVSRYPDPPPLRPGTRVPVSALQRQKLRSREALPHLTDPACIVGKSGGTPARPYRWRVSSRLRGAAHMFSLDPAYVIDRWGRTPAPRGEWRCSFCSWQALPCLSSPAAYFGHRLRSLTRLTRLMLCLL